MGRSLLEANQNRRALGFCAKNCLVGLSVLGDTIARNEPPRNRKSGFDKNPCLFKCNLNN